MQEEITNDSHALFSVLYSISNNSSRTYWFHEEMSPSTGFDHNFIFILYSADKILIINPEISL